MILNKTQEKNIDTSIPLHNFIILIDKNYNKYNNSIFFRFYI